MGRTLHDLLDQVESATDTPPVSVETVLDHLGERSFSPVILVVALLMVSPLSGIPGAPTVASVLIVTVGCQSVLGRDYLWLPGTLLRRTIPTDRLRKAVRGLRRPADWFDGHSHTRWPLLTTQPMRLVATLTCILVAMIWPLLELLPFVTSFGAGAVSLLSFGLLTRDGLYVLLGYGIIIALVVAAVALIDIG